jgi:hypothetical protein
VLIAVSTPRIQSSKVLLSVAPRHGGQECKFEPSSMTPAISSAKAEKRTFEQPAGRCTGIIVDAPKLNHAFASSRTLAAAVPRVGIEELIEISEAKDSKLLFVPIACRSQCFEVAYDLCARLRIQLAAPGRPQNTI